MIGMKNLIRLMTFLFLITINSVVYAQVRIVFYHVQASEGISENIKQQFQNIIMERLALSHIVEPVQIDNVYALFDSLGFSSESCTSTECAIKIGRSTQASKSMYVKLQTDKQMVNLRAWLFDIEKNTIEYITNPYPVAADQIREGINQFIGDIEANIPIIPRIVNINSSTRAIIDCGGDHGIRRGTFYDIIKRVQRGVNIEEVKIAHARISNVNERNAEIVISNRLPAHNIDVGQILKIRKGKDKQPPVMDPELFDICTVNKPVKIYLHLNDPSGISFVYLYFKTNLDKEFQKISMKLENGDRYLAIVPAEEVRGGEIEFYFEASDQLGNQKTLKKLGAFPYKAVIKSEDIIPPVVEHQPVRALNKGMYWDVSAKVTDNTKIDAVLVHYHFEDDSVWITKKFTKYGGDIFGSDILIADTTSKNLLEYYLEAVDISGNITNFASKPEPITILVGTDDYVKPVINDDFAYWDDTTNTIIINVTATDNIKVLSVSASISIMGKFLTNLQLDTHNRDNYQGKLPLPADNLNSIDYKIIVTDLGDNITTSSVTTIINPAKLKTIKSDKKKPKQLGNHYKNSFCFVQDSTMLNNPFSPAHYLITFNIEDNVSVNSLNLFYRPLGDNDYREVTVYNWEKTLFSTLVEGIAWGIEYYATASDPNNNVLKLKSANKPYKIEEPRAGVFPSLLKRFNQ